MPSKSQAQQSAAAIAKLVKEGKMTAKPGSPSAQMAKSMKSGDIEKFASTSRTGLPKHVRPARPKAPAPASRPTGKERRMRVNNTPTGAIKNLGPAKGK